MELSKQVTSLEISKKLKELGVKQESLFVWTAEDEFGKREICLLPEGHHVHPDGYSALTVAELGEMLPRMICDDDQPLSGTEGKCFTLVQEFLSDDYSSGMKIDGFRLKYGDSKVEIKSKPELNSAGVYYQESEADVRGKMLIYLLENKLI